MYTRRFKPKNIYKYQADSRKAGEHTHINKLKEKQYLKELKKLIEEEINVRQDSIENLE